MWFFLRSFDKKKSLCKLSTRFFFIHQANILKMSTEEHPTMTKWHALWIIVLKTKNTQTQSSDKNKRQERNSKLKKSHTVKNIATKCVKIAEVTQYSKLSTRKTHNDKRNWDAATVKKASSKSIEMYAFYFSFLHKKSFSLEQFFVFLCDHFIRKCWVLSNIDFNQSLQTFTTSG